MDYTNDSLFSYENIRSRIIENYKLETNKTEGSFAVDTANSVATELAQGHHRLQENLKLSFAKYAYDNYLDMIVQEVGLKRKEATFAIGTLRIEGKDDTRISKGSLFSNDTQDYETTSEVIINNGFVEVEIKCIKVGALGNTLKDTIVNMPIYIEGIDNISNTNNITNGSDEEDDDTLRERYFDFVQIPASSGNLQNYINWAREVSGVGRAKVYSQFYGAGTVRVIITNSEMEDADEVLIKKTLDYIEVLRPVGANVYVETAIKKDITVNVNIKLTGEKSLEEIKQEFQESLQGYFKNLALKENYLSYAKIGSLLFSITGVGDYEELKINNEKENVSFEDDEFPKLLKINIDGTR